MALGAPRMIAVACGKDAATAAALGGAPRALVLRHGVAEKTTMGLVGSMVAAERTTMNWLQNRRPPLAGCMDV